MAGHRMFDLLTRIEQVEDHLTEKILSFLDADSLYNAFCVCKSWRNIFRRARIWKKLIEKNVASNPVWAYVVEQKGLLPTDLDDRLYERIYFKIVAGIRELDNRWKSGQCTQRDIQLPDGLGEFASHNDEEIIFNSFHQGKNLIRIFDTELTILKRRFYLSNCRIETIQFDARMVIGACDKGHIHIWKRDDPDGSGPCNTYSAQCPQLGEIKFKDNLLVGYCMKSLWVQRAVVIAWEVTSPEDVRLLGKIPLWGRPSELDCEDKFIVCGFLEGNIMIWDKKTLKFLMELFVTDEDSIVAIHCRDGLVAVAYLDRIGIWDAESGQCIRSYDVVDPEVIRLTERRILFTSEEFGLRVVDLEAFLDETVPDEALECISLEPDLFSCPYKVRFDDLRIKCWLHQRTMRIFDFRNPAPPAPNQPSSEVIEWMSEIHDRPIP